MNPSRALIGVSCWLILMSIIVPAQAGDEGTTKSFIYKKTKQADLEIVVHYPPGWKETDKRPAIVFFFGGGWTSGTIRQFEPQANHLASGAWSPPGRLPGEVAARRHAQGVRRGRQECRPLDAAERRQARRRSRPDRGRRRIGGRPHRRLHRLHAGAGSRRRGHERLVKAQCPGPLQPGAAVQRHPAADGTDRQRRGRGQGDFADPAL